MHWFYLIVVGFSLHFLKSHWSTLRTLGRWAVVLESSHQCATNLRKGVWLICCSGCIDYLHSIIQVGGVLWLAVSERKLITASFRINHWKKQYTVMKCNVKNQMAFAMIDHSLPLTLSVRNMYRRVSNIVHVTHQHSILKTNLLLEVV